VHSTLAAEVIMDSEWQKPEFTELAMNAEIGAYQEDSGGRGNPPVLAPAAAAPADSNAETAE
jgi:hypothetical protein